MYWACRKFVVAPNIDSAYFTKFGVDMTIEVFQPQSCQSWTIEKKVPECFRLNFLHTTSALLHVIMKSSSAL